LTASLRAGDSVSIDGFEIGLALHDQMSRLTLTGEGVRAERCLIAQIERNDKAPVARDLDALGSTLRGATYQLVQEEPFWREIDRFYDTAPNLFAATAAWLERA
jgi:hypothetical protein